MVPEEEAFMPMHTLLQMTHCAVYLGYKTAQSIFWPVIFTETHSGLVSAAGIRCGPLSLTGNARESEDFMVKIVSVTSDGVALVLGS